MDLICKDVSEDVSRRYDAYKRPQRPPGRLPGRFPLCWTIGVWMATSREIEDSMIGDDIVLGINVIRVVGRERWWLEGGHGQT